MPPKPKSDKPNDRGNSLRVRPVPTHGTKESVCAACHVIFSSVSAFDQHQTFGPRKNKRKPDRVIVCHAPEDRGLAVVRYRASDQAPVYGSDRDRLCS